MYVFGNIVTIDCDLSGQPKNINRLEFRNLATCPIPF